MLQANVDRIVKQLKPTDKVLDIGGWFIPFWRADHVVDLLPYETRGRGGCTPCGLPGERFDRSTWTLWDISSAQPLPFPDQSFDFVVCSHTLEDIRDPILACREILRVGKAGYLEVPSRLMESTLGVEHPGYCGWYHHRWLVEIEEDEIRFQFKPHCIHSTWKYHFPRRYLERLAPEDTVAWLFWSGTFRFREIISISDARVKQQLTDFVRSRGGHPSWRYALSGFLDRVRAGVRPAHRKARKAEVAAFWHAVGDIDSR